ncbi:MAG: hypothetical protein K5829_04415 [Treponema sp.]|nr:hypothetical protein [Treponema sp.]
MKNKIYFTILIAAVLLFTASCSNLFESFINNSGAVKTGDSSVRVDGNSESYSPEDDETSVVSNDEPEAYYEFSTEGKEIKNTDISSGIVVIKSKRPENNQIVFSNDIHFYEIGYTSTSSFDDYELEADGETLKSSSSEFTDEQKSGRESSSSVFLTADDDPVIIKAFKNDSNATVIYSAVQTRTTNYASIDNDSEAFIAEDAEVFIDLESSEQKKVSFTKESSAEGEPIVLEDLPYGTTRVTVKIQADDDYYSDEYVILLNKRHYFTSLVKPETDNQEKTNLTTGLVVLKESSSYCENQINYLEGQQSYIVGSVGDLTNSLSIGNKDDFSLFTNENYYLNASDDFLTEADNLVYVKAIPASESAAVTWSAYKVAEAVYTYDYYKTISTTILVTSPEGNIISGPETSSVTEKISSSQTSESQSQITEESDEDGNIVTKTVTTTIRKNITGLDYMKPLEEYEDITESILSPVENQNSDRVRTVKFPYGFTIIKIRVAQQNSVEKNYAEYLIGFSKVQFTTSSGLEEDSQNEIVEDDTSKLEDLTVINKEVIDDNGDTVDITTTATQSFEFDESVSMYSIVVDEETDEIIINPSLSENEVMTNPVTKTKNSEIQFDDTRVPLLGGLQVISFTVTEEGCESRTYTLYVYKSTGNTRLGKINYASFDSIDNKLSKQSMSVNNYDEGISAMSPSSVKESNGGTSSAPQEYSLYTRADCDVDVTRMSFNVLPYDEHSRIAYYVGDTCPEEDSSDWSEDYLASDEKEFVESAESASEQSEELYRISFDLNDQSESDYAETYLWLRLKSRAYNHAAEDGSISRYSDIAYHKIVINKASESNSNLNYLSVVKIAEEKTSEEKVYKYQTESDVKYTVPSSIASTEIPSDYDSVKLKFRLAHKSDSESSGVVTYTAVNSRSSDTCGIANTDFEGYAAEDSPKQILPDENGYYTIVLGKEDIESITTSSSETEEERAALEGETSSSSTEVSVVDRKDSDGRVISSVKTTTVTDITVVDNTATVKSSVTIQTTEYSFEDFPMGSTAVKIYVDGKLSESLIYTKPDRDSFEIDNTPSSADCAGGSYQYKNGIFYINNDVESISLNVTMHQKNQSLFVLDYKKLSGLNGCEDVQLLESSLVSSSQNGTSRVWNSVIKNIPVGTSRVTYGISNSYGEKNNSAFTVTIVRDGDNEARLRAFTLNQYESDGEESYSEEAVEIFKQGSGFDWSSSGTYARTDSDDAVNVYDIYEKTISTAKYSLLAQSVSSSASISSELYATNNVNISTEEIIEALSSNSEALLFTEDNSEADEKLLLLESADETSYENYKLISLGTATDWIVSADSYVRYLVHTKVTSNDNSNVHHYYLWLTVNLDSSVELDTLINQYSDKNAQTCDDESSLSDGSESSSTSSQDGITIIEQTYSVSTNLNRTGKIVIRPEKNETASWYGDISVLLYNQESESSSSLNENLYTIDSESHEVTISQSIYDEADILGNEIWVKYGIISQNRENVLYRSCKLFISTLTSVTEYLSWSNTQNYSYQLPASTYQNQLAFRYASLITDNNHPAKGLEHGGIDVIGSTDSGSTWGTSSYNFSGFHYVIKLDSKLYLVALRANENSSTEGKAFAFYEISQQNGIYTINSESEDLETSNGLIFNVNSIVQYDGENPYLTVSAEVESDSELSLGVIMDTLVAEESKATDPTADSVEIVETNNGFEMAGDGYKFNLLLKNALGVDDVDGFWYGSYTNETSYSYFQTLFDSSAECSSSVDDSALSFFWNLSSGSNTKIFRLSLSEN